MEDGQALGWFLTWVVFSFSIFLSAKILPFVKLKGLMTAFWVAAIYGLLKLLFYNLLVFLSLPFIAITFGLFFIVVNAILLWLTDKLVSGFKINGFLLTMAASLVITIMDMVLKAVVQAVI